MTEISSKLTSGKGKPPVRAPKNKATALVPSYSKVKLSRPIEVNVSVLISSATAEPSPVSCPVCAFSNRASALLPNS